MKSPPQPEDVRRKKLAGESPWMNIQLQVVLCILFTIGTLAGKRSENVSLVLLCRLGLTFIALLWIFRWIYPWFRHAFLHGLHADTEVKKHFKKH